MQRPNASGTIDSYDHTQRGVIHRVVAGFALAALAAAVVVGVEGDAAADGGEGERGAIVFALGLTGGLMLLVAAAFAWLRVCDEGDALQVSFGPVPLFSRRVRYDTIRSVEVGRTTWLHGWGIHLALGGGWVWNIHGFDCVVIGLERSRLLLGTDDPDGLAAFLRGRLAGRQLPAAPPSSSATSAPAS